MASGEWPRFRIISSSAVIRCDVEPVGEGVSEMREHFGPGWRMYYVQRGEMLIIMLGGGDKSTQSADIQRAIALAKTLED